MGSEHYKIIRETVFTKQGAGIAVFLLLGALLYGNTLSIPFYLDDAGNLQENLPRITSFSVDNLLDTAFGGLLRRRPLPNLTFALNFYFHGTNVRGYHLINIGIHIFSGILLYWLIFKTLSLSNCFEESPQQAKGNALPDAVDNQRQAMMVALVSSLVWFAHPLQIQAVTYIVQRMTSLATLFSLASLLAYLYARLTRHTSTRIFLFAVATAVWILATASKEIALPLPVLVFFYEWFFFQKLSGSWFKRWFIFGSAGLVILLTIAYWLYGYSPITFLTVIEQPRGFTAFERLLTEGRVVFLYMGLLIFPHPTRLNLNHDIAISRSLTEPITTLYSLLGILAIAGFVVYASRQNRLTAYCILWFFIGISLEALAASIEPMFEHRVYMPSMLFFLPVIYLAAKKIKKSIALVSLSVAWVLVLSIWTIQRNNLWNNPVAFWQDAVTKSPKHFRSHFQLGTCYLNIGDNDRALESLKHALSLNPPYPTEIFTNIAIAYYKKGDTLLAMENAQRAYAMDPRNYIALDLMGTLDRDRGDYQGAIEKFQKALGLQPNFIQAAQNLGMLFLENGKFEHATNVFEKLVENHPMSSQGYKGMGLTFARQDKVDLALSMFEQAVTKNARDYDAFYNLAISYALTNQYHKAADTYESVLEIAPTDVETMHNLGVLYLRDLHDTERAIKYFKQALATDPGYSHAAIARQIVGQGDGTHRDHERTTR